MLDRLNWACEVCGNVGLSDGFDGFFYCGRCGSQAQDIIDTATAEEDHFENAGGCAIYSASLRRIRPQTFVKAEPISQFQSQQTQLWDFSAPLWREDEADGLQVGDATGPIEPSDFGFRSSASVSSDDYYLEIRMRYTLGIQIMIQLQCKALVKKFNISPLIVGFAATIYGRFVALQRVFADDWADQAIHESESQPHGHTNDFRPKASYRSEPLNIYGQRAVTIWHRLLNKTIPLYYSLVISFLACHMAREATLPTDIIKWTVEGKLPYFAAFVEIEKQIGPPTAACPISSSNMFRPTKEISSYKLESLAASIATSIALELPPVNFNAVASRFISQLSLPVNEILPHACRIFEWSMPPGLWLSANIECVLPTRVCVMSIIIVSIRILYDIHGFGKWEMSLSSSCESSSLNKQNGDEEYVCGSTLSDDTEMGISHHLEDNGSDSPVNNVNMRHKKLEVVEILQKLEAKYKELLPNAYEYSKDLPTYLEYCKDVAFAGLDPSVEDYEEEKIIEDLWDFYQKKRNCEPLDGGLHGQRTLKRSMYDDLTSLNQSKKFKEDRTSSSMSMEDSDLTSDENESHKDRAIRRLKMNMEENRFSYIPPRQNVRKHDYLHYSRKKDNGAYTYAVHADYYILLRSCAKAAQVDLRTMHYAVLGFERRLKLLEEEKHLTLSVKHSKDTPQLSCDVELKQKDTVESMNSP